MLKYELQFLIPLTGASIVKARGFPITWQLPPSEMSAIYFPACWTMCFSGSVPSHKPYSMWLLCNHGHLRGTEHVLFHILVVHCDSFTRIDSYVGFWVWEMLWLCSVSASTTWASVLIRTIFQAVDITGWLIKRWGRSRKWLVALLSSCSDWSSWIWQDSISNC